MPSPFPGMDPYLEKSTRWRNVHGRLTVAIADALSPLLLPKYQPIIEESVYRAGDQDSVMIGVPDVAVTKVISKKTSEELESQRSSVAVAPIETSPIIVELPVPVSVRQRFIEIRDTENQEVVTVIEVLSPTNKRGDGRKQYLKKRERLLASKANLVELDFLHSGKAMPMLNSDIESHYRILVSTLQLRPQALLYPFNLTQPLPVVAIPLRENDKTPKVDFQALLDQVYERSGYEFSIDYTQPPTPTWDEAELSWISQQINQN